MDENYWIRKLTYEEINFPIEWAKQEGWNPGLYDKDCFYQADSGGFLGGFINNQLIATISAIKYGEKFGFIGFYIVKPDYRKQGYGLKIWQEAIKSLSGRNIGLDGVVSQQDNYRKSGFKLAYRNIRYQGISNHNIEINKTVIDLSSISFEIINNYDKQFFPDDRTNFLKQWIRQPESKVLGIIEGDKLRGYGMVRVCDFGYKIAPLFAENFSFAESIFVALQSNIPEGKTFYLDIPEVNHQANILVDKYNLNLVFETARMYNREIPSLPVDKIFGVTSFELG
ncbi:GNAT family N-acetyltransferase [Cyanobacterium aponinum]|uniref:GNAT family N-acetyltransferase n=1 Tax=Cyanobacterium aponinum 0216 TaxID=2676140 RepID=A0A844GWL4_9CHRO|nr:GNAT family N-acetyltransferase [Cyanobacterium aponinum]MTF40570.1 GNAT family N-acetyltransferase [Cyanobacterium aponinum 0216]